MYSGFKESGEWFQLSFESGIPARPHGDGVDGHCLWPEELRARAFEETGFEALK
jgi:hypothetical protein